MDALINAAGGNRPEATTNASRSQNRFLLTDEQTGELTERGRIILQYPAYYHEWRTHLSLGKDAPVPRPMQPPACGPIVQVADPGGLRHHDERRAA